MDYRYLLQEENERVMERYQLSMDRIRAMKEEDMAEPYGGYFRSVGAFVEMMDELVNSLYEGEELSLAQMAAGALWGKLRQSRLRGKKAGKGTGTAAVLSLYGNPRGDCPGL